MPNKDGTGPKSEGAKTGRQSGKCEGANPVAKNPVERMGCKRHRGRGRAKN